MKANTYYYFLKGSLHDLEWASLELRSFLTSPVFPDLDDASKDALNRTKIILDNTIEAIERKIGTTTTVPHSNQ